MADTHFKLVWTVLRHFLTEKPQFWTISIKNHENLHKSHFSGLVMCWKPWNLVKVVYKVDTWSSEGFSAIFLKILGLWAQKISKIPKIGTEIVENLKNHTFLDL